MQDCLIVVPKWLSKWEGALGTQCLHMPSSLPGYCFKGSMVIMAGTFRLEKSTDRQRLEWILGTFLRSPKNLGSYAYANGVYQMFSLIYRTLGNKAKEHCINPLHLIAAKCAREISCPLHPIAAKCAREISCPLHPIAAECARTSLPLFIVIAAPFWTWS